MWRKRFLVVLETGVLRWLELLHSQTPKPEHDLRRETARVTERQDDDSALDEALEETFPASDAPANTVETGIHVGPGALLPDVIDNRAASRYELSIDGLTATLTYQRGADTLTLVHAEVPEVLRGRGLGDALVSGSLALARAEHRRLVVMCPFVRAYLRRHPQ
jgi:predicted GNAT family acetyltransferase